MILNDSSNKQKRVVENDLRPCLTLFFSLSFPCSLSPLFLLSRSNKEMADACGSVVCLIAREGATRGGWVGGRRGRGKDRGPMAKKEMARSGRR